MEVRAIRQSDVESFRDALDSVASERQFLRTLEAPPVDAVARFVANNIARGFPHFVALIDDQVIGWADFIPEEEESLAHTAHLGMGVRKEHRGKGVGEALLFAVTAAAFDAGFVRLELEVFANNRAAIALYEKHGFSHEGRKRKARCIDGHYIDALIMAKFSP